MIVKVKDKEYEIKKEDEEFYHNICKELNNNIDKLPSKKESFKSFYIDVAWLFFLFFLISLLMQTKSEFFSFITIIVTIIVFFKTIGSLIKVLTPQKLLDKINEVGDTEYLKSFINKRVRVYKTAGGLEIEENFGFFETDVVGNFGGERLEDILWKIYKSGGNAIINFHQIKRKGAADTISGDIVRVKDKKQINLD